MAFLAVLNVQTSCKVSDTYWHRSTKGQDGTQAVHTYWESLRLQGALHSRRILPVLLGQDVISTPDVPWHSLWGQFLSSYSMLAVQVIDTKVTSLWPEWQRAVPPWAGLKLVHVIAGSNVLSRVSNSTAAAAATAILQAPGKYLGHTASLWSRQNSESNPLKAFIDFNTAVTF